MFNEKTVIAAAKQLTLQQRLKRNETLKFIIPFAIALGAVLYILFTILSLVFVHTPFTTALKTNGKIILVMVPFGLIMTFILEGRSYRHQNRILRDAKKSLLIIENLIQTKAPFILYLYDFNSGSDSIRYDGIPAAGSSGVHYIDGNHRREIISRKLHQHIPVVYLYNARESNYGYKGYALIVDDATWYSSFITLYQYATYVVIDYKDVFATSLNIQMELKYIIENKGNPNIIFSGTTDELALLTKGYPTLPEMILGSFKMVGKSTNSRTYITDNSGYYTIDETDELFNRIIQQQL